MLKSQGHRPLLVACDVYRPAAITQLQVVGERAGVPVFEMGTANPVDIARKAMAHAKDHGNDYVLLDTAGRLHIDEQLMDETRKTYKADGRTAGNPAGGRRHDRSGRGECRRRLTTKRSASTV